MLGKVIRHWWRVATLASALAGMWCCERASQTDQRWNEQIVDTMRKRNELGQQIAVEVAALRKADNLIDQFERACRIGELQAERLILQNEALQASQDLYIEKDRYMSLAFVFLALTAIIPYVGTWQLRWMARRRRRAMCALAANYADPDEDLEEGEPLPDEEPLPAPG